LRRRARSKTRRERKEKRRRAPGQKRQKKGGLARRGKGRKRTHLHKREKRPGVKEPEEDEPLKVTKKKS